MSVLARIFEGKRAEVAAAKARLPLTELKAQAADASPVRPFVAALRESPHRPSLIAEVKKASPSQGLIRPDFDPAEVARAYAEAGASALSVLTDVPHFQGAPEYLPLAREASGLPVLRKDFLYDPYQVYEARAWGADAVLLIAAMLDDNTIRELQALTHQLGMDALVEVHSEHEADRVLEIGCPFVGVNNRDLSTFKTSLAIGDSLLPRLTRHALAVSESALESRADIDRVSGAGARAVLIGTAFCAAPDISSKVREVMAWR